jgi:hypothetical protein
MNQPKLCILVEIGTVERVVAKPVNGGWVVIVSYKTIAGIHIEPLERQRKGPRIFATLDAVASTLRAAGIMEFCVNQQSAEGLSDAR